MTFGPEDFQTVTNVSRETLDKFQIYADLLQTWQGKINLVGPSTLGDIWERHFYDSAQLLPFINKTPLKDISRSWLDLGPGAGFPGLVLSLLGEHPVYLVERNPKKCAFLRQIIRETGAGAKVVQGDIETLEAFPVTIITSRALTTIKQILSWSLPFLDKKGEYWLLKGQDVEQELTFLKKNRNMKIELFPSATDKGGQIVRLYGSGEKKPEKR